MHESLGTAVPFISIPPGNGFGRASAGKEHPRECIDHQTQGDRAALLQPPGKSPAPLQVHFVFPSRSGAACAVQGARPRCQPCRMFVPLLPSLVAGRFHPRTLQEMLRVCHISLRAPTRIGTAVRQAGARQKSPELQMTHFPVIFLAGSVNVKYF